VLTLLVRILIVILLLRVVVGVVQALSGPSRTRPRRVPDPPRPPQRRPREGEIVDAEFEDLESDR
jgi:hypothetical protein